MKKIMVVVALLSSLVMADWIGENTDLADKNNNFNRWNLNGAIEHGSFGFMYRYQIDDMGDAPDKIKTMYQPKYIINESWNTEYRYSEITGNQWEQRLRLTWKGVKVHELLTLGARYEWVWGNFAQSGDTEFGWFRLMAKTEYPLNDKVSIYNSFEPRFWTNHKLYSGKVFAYQNNIGLKVKLGEGYQVKAGLESFFFPEYMNKDSQTYPRIDLQYKF